MRWTTHVTCIGEMRSANTDMSENLKASDQLGHLGVCGRTLLKYISFVSKTALKEDID
jgi:hypothetical protein